MKRRIVLGTLIATAFVFVAGYGVYRSVHHRAPVADVELRDVEQLARGESGDDNTKTVCYSRSSGNTGKCREVLNASGNYICAGSEWYEFNNCYSHGPAN